MSLELVDEILDYVDRQFPEPSLKYTDPDADAATADLFRTFCFFIKEVNKDPKVGWSTARLGCEGGGKLFLAKMVWLNSPEPDLFTQQCISLHSN